MTIDYKFNEEKLLKEIKEYIDKTYSSHYTGNGQNKIQSLEVIFDRGWGEGFCCGSITKYIQRLGYKDGYNRADIIKTIHYALLLLHAHDLRSQKTIVAVDDYGRK